MRQKMKCLCSVSILALFVFGNVAVFADDSSADGENAETKPRARNPPADQQETQPVS